MSSGFRFFFIASPQRFVASVGGSARIGRLPQSGQVCSTTRARPELR
jgi:hypothetical protein